MQSDLDTLAAAASAPLAISILGVNEAGQERGNPSITGTLPWLQDTSAQQAWVRWGVEWRDVVVLDADNVPIAIYNLTAHDLHDPANYAALRDILVQAAAGTGPSDSTSTSP
jgi:hypothetical protein